MKFRTQHHYLKKTSPLFIILNHLFKKLLHILLPPQCVSCDQLLENTLGVCPSCWKKVTFISDPYCICCGMPFELDLEEDLICGECYRQKPFFDVCRSVVAYNKNSRSLIIKFKHSDALYLAPLFTRWLKAISVDLITSEALIVPVPLHWTRLFTRTYNQAAILARLLAIETKTQFLPTALKRKRRTSSQGGLSRKARIENVSGCFELNLKYQDIIRHKRVILIDDVFTTGATVNACAKVLKKAGAKKIIVLTLGRVIN